MTRAREAFYRELDAVVISSLPHARQMNPVFQSIGLRPEIRMPAAQ
jgi:Rrf2 family nitric oxide-sensitive transcriptional repressor